MKELRANPTEHFQKLNPEVIMGKEYVTSVVEAYGTGKGFGLSGLHLQKNWSTRMVDFDKEKQEHLTQYLNEQSKKFSLPQGKIIFDKEGIPRELYVGKDPMPSSRLIDDAFSINNGTYMTKKADDLSRIVVIQDVLSQYLKYHYPENAYPYITMTDDCFPSFGSMNLSVPKNCPAITDIEKYKSIILPKSHNIAGRFGESIDDIFFQKETGIISSIVLSGSFSTGYVLNAYSDQMFYSPNNIDKLHQAATCHTIIATDLNLRANLV